MNFQDLLNSFSNSNVSTGLASGLVGGLAGSLLMSKTGRKIGKNALKLGGVAAVGALAYSAYKKYSNKEGDKVVDMSTQKNILTNSTDESGFLPAENDEESIHKLELILVKAMLAASRADGQVDIKETQTIINQIRSFNLEDDEEGQLMQQLALPTDIEDLVTEARTIELATEIYTVSLLVIEQANEVEREYLTMLSERLKLPKDLTVAIEKEVNEHKHKQAA